MRLRMITFAVATLAICSTVRANDDRNEMNNSHVKIEATEHRNGRNVESVKIVNKTHLKGKDSAYKKNKLTRALQPYAEYPITSKMSGGQYRVVCFYRLEKDGEKNDNHQITIGMDELSPIEHDLKPIKGVNRLEMEFDVKALRGKNHILKVWFTSPNIAVDRFEVRRKLIKN
ncbi:MAG: hypothetical protein ACRC6R_07500 [Bacteroidales bacterium]